MIFVGLEDLNVQYETYRVPDPDAPYPQDYVIDPAGVVADWSGEYDPQRLVEVIDALLAATGADPPASPDGAPELRLGAATPCPFRTATALDFDLPGPRSCEVSVFDASGRLVRTLERGALSGGRHTVRWDGRDASGAAVATGVYFIRLDTGDLVGVTKAVLLR
jgi:hypothetical protein